MQLYDFVVKNNKGEDIKLEQYKGKVLLIVNTATKCGYTKQYDGLEALYDKYQEKGLEILDFPCNQFLSQAKGSDEDIHSFCVMKFNTKFPRFKKICVNKVSAKDQNEGFSETEPLYVYLKEQMNVKRITWNFNKFLVNRDGVVVAYYPSQITPEELEEEIVKLL